MASTYSIIGQPIPARVDGTGKVTGVTRYADDLFLSCMLSGKLLRSPHPHARILSVDTSKAAALLGVFAVIPGANGPQPYSIMPMHQDEHTPWPSTQSATWATRRLPWRILRSASTPTIG